MNNINKIPTPEELMERWHENNNDADYFITTPEKQEEYRRWREKRDASERVARERYEKTNPYFVKTLDEAKEKALRSFLNYDTGEIKTIEAAFMAGFDSGYMASKTTSL